MFSSEQCYESQKDINIPTETRAGDHKKEKKIKKRKNKRNCSRITQTSDDINNLEEIVSQTGSSYFGLSKNKITDQFCYKFKTNLHIRNIIGKEPNVYNIKKEDSFVNETLQYLHLIGNRHRGRVSKVLLTNQHTKKAMKFINISSNQNRKIVLLDSEEATLLSKRNQMQLEMENFFTQIFSNTQEIQLDFLTKELLTLCKLNSIQEHEIVQKIYSYAMNSSDVLHKAHQNSIQVYNEQQEKYISFLIRKNMRKGLEQTPIDMLNYFNVIDAEQKNVYDDTSLTLCKTLEDLKFYLKLKKPKQGKHPDDSLKTCCSACFSNYYQIMNPIETCTECGMRMHKLCQTIRSKCQRCKYIRKTIEQKSNIPYCLICQRQKQQNISIEFIYDGQKQYYAHTFCLLTTNSWSIKNKEICYQMPKFETIYAETCKVCNKANSFCIDCKCCNGKVHGMCAFLEGYSMKINDQNKLFVESCQNFSNNKFLSMNRKFKMNYQKILYKNNEDLFKMIQLSH